MQTILKLEKVSFSYPESREHALSNLSFQLQQGDFAVLCGQSASGKTTLLRQLKPAIAPAGQTGGEIFFEDTLLHLHTEKTLCEKIGYLFQSPDDQIICDTVRRELSYTLENLGYDDAEISCRIAEICAYFGIDSWLEMETANLSGGQKQLLNLASVMITQPSLLLLDEPTAYLDPVTSVTFLSALKRLNTDFGTTILLGEHHLDEVLPHANKVITLECGRITAQGTPQEILKTLFDAKSVLFPAMPAAARISAVAEKGEAICLTIAQGRRWAARFFAQKTPVLLARKEECPSKSDVFLQGKQVWFRYEKQGDDILKGASFSIQKGTVCALLGGNGAGKSTLLSLLCGENQPYDGNIRWTDGSLPSVSLLPQNPQTLFLYDTVQDNLSFCIKTDEKEEKQRKLDQIAQEFELVHLLQSNPFDLSGGEMQRVAIAQILLLERQVLLLDEPTKGMDYQWKAKLGQILLSLQKQGRTVIFASHDLDFCAQYAQSCALLSQGRILCQTSCVQFFSSSLYYTTAAHRMMREINPEIITVDDGMFACLGENREVEIVLPQEKQIMQNSFPLDTAQEKECSPPSLQMQKEKTQDKARMANLISILLLAVILPATLYFGSRFFGMRRYYLLSIFSVIEILAAFFLSFELKETSARRLTFLSILTAITVAGRAVFFFLPQAKPVAALVILWGAALGGQSGFLIGAMSMLLSNLFFGQGPWTPFQMFAMGLLGFLSGLLFHRKQEKEIDRDLLCLFGGFSVLLIYGFIMNTYSVFQMQDHITLKMLLAACIAGVPMDISHAVSTMVFLYFGTKPILSRVRHMIRKL